MPHEPLLSSPDRGAGTRGWRVPPPLLHGPESLESAEILNELPGPLGLLLWRCVRDVTLWSTAAGSEARVGMFSAEAARRHLDALAGTDPELREPLQALASMLAHPADVSAEAVTLACSRVSQWAASNGSSATALAWAQAAALAAPASAPAALRVGVLARRRGDYARAEGWLQRTVMLARRAGDAESHAAAYSALGNLRLVRGNLPAAERCHRRALRLARRFRLRARAAAALHDLFVVCAQRGRDPEAMQHARAAVRLYPPRSPALPALAHDVAVFWMEHQQYARALPVLRAVWPHMDRHQRITGMANLARAAAAVGDRATFEEFWTLAWATVRSAEYVEKHPSVLLELARAAADLGEPQRAREAATAAHRLACELGEQKAVFDSEEFLESLDRTPPAPPAPPAANPREDELAHALVGSLSGVA